MKDLRKFIKTTIREFLNENTQNYDIVYRGQPIDVNDISPRNSIWVTYDYDFANEYGNVKEYKLPKNLNIFLWYAFLSSQSLFCSSLFQTYTIPDCDNLRCRLL